MKSSLSKQVRNFKEKNWEIEREREREGGSDRGCQRDKERQTNKEGEWVGETQKRKEWDKVRARMTEREM